MHSRLLLLRLLWERRQHTAGLRHVLHRRINVLQHLRYLHSPRRAADGLRHHAAARGHTAGGAAVRDAQAARLQAQASSSSADHAPPARAAGLAQRDWPPRGAPGQLRVVVLLGPLHGCATCGVLQGKQQRLARAAGSQRQACKRVPCLGTRRLRPTHRLSTLSQRRRARADGDTRRGQLPTTWEPPLFPGPLLIRPELVCDGQGVWGQEFKYRRIRD